MLKYSLITALLAFSGLMAHAQTTAAPAVPMTPAAPAKAATAPTTPASTAKPSAKAASAEPEVKKSKSGICHDKSSKSYKQTKHFTEFKTMEECVKSGGHAPKK